MYHDGGAWIGSSSAGRPQDCSAETSRLQLYGPAPSGERVSCFVQVRCPSRKFSGRNEHIQSPDNLQTEISVTSAEMAGGCPPVNINILAAPDTLQTEVSVMAVMSEKGMERFVINPQVLFSDGLAPYDDPERQSPDVGGDAGVIQDPMPTVVSVRPRVAEEWMDRFVIDLVECPSVSRTSVVARTFGPAVSEEYSPVFFVFAGGGGGSC